MNEWKFQNEDKSLTIKLFKKCYSNEILND